MALICRSAAGLHEGRKPLLKPAADSAPGLPISGEARDRLCRCARCSAWNQKLLPCRPLRPDKVATAGFVATLLSRRPHCAGLLWTPRQCQQSIVATSVVLEEVEGSNPRKNATIERVTSSAAIRSCNLRRAGRRIGGLGGPVAGPDRCYRHALARHEGAELPGMGVLTSAVCNCGGPSENQFLQPWPYQRRQGNGF